MLDVIFGKKVLVFVAIYHVDSRSINSYFSVLDIKLTSSLFLHYNINVTEHNAA